MEMAGGPPFGCGLVRGIRLPLKTANTKPVRYLSFLLCALALHAGHAQSGPGEEVRAVIDRFFEGFHQRDTALMQTVLHQRVHMQRIGRDPSGVPVLQDQSVTDFLISIASLPDTLQVRERLLDYRIQTDGDMAHAWTPYEFYLQGAFHHCGVNSFQLVRGDGSWKIIYIVDTRRVGTCLQEE